jgi:hypothetical protein
MRSPGTLLPQNLSRRNETALEGNPLGVLRIDVTAQVGGGPFERRELTADERGGDGRPLPEVVMIGLGDSRTEAALQLRLQRQKLLALSLERMLVGEMEVDLDERDVADSYSSVRSTCAFS